MVLPSDDVVVVIGVVIEVVEAVGVDVSNVGCSVVSNEDFHPGVIEYN